MKIDERFMNSSTAKVPGEKHLFSALDAMRGIAAVSVVFYHAGIHSGLPLLPHAYLAVDLFFVLSGFVIAHAYEEKLHHGMTVGKFM
jgi:peptidoglycan/LPS O-acetylase OafA/YrhL